MIVAYRIYILYSGVMSVSITNTDEGFMFKVGDIVQYVKGNDEWVKAKLIFKVINIISGDLDKTDIEIESLQDIPLFPITQTGGFKKGYKLQLEKNKFKLLTERKNHLPKWW